MKKLASFIISILLVMSFVVVAPIVSQEQPVSQVSASGKTIDVYFISGQSNAAGETHYNTITTTKSEYTSGYQNIYIHGAAMNAGDVKKGRSFVYPELVTGDKGNSSGRFGPELGMADYLSTYYNKTTGKEAIFIKYACGAASLDGQAGTGWGNFCPPSKLSESTVKGENLYYNLTNTVKDALTALKNNGYTNVNYKGFFWSQGEAEIYNTSRASKYGSYLEALINDFRSDLYTITQPIFGANSGATALPFLIAEISPYFNKSTVYKGQDNLVYSNTSGINTIVAGQRAVAKKLTNVETLYTGDYILNEQSNPGCRDPYHYSGDDNVDIGKRAGKILYELTAEGLICTLAGDLSSDTTVSQVINQDGSVVVTWSNGGALRRVKSITFKNQDITSSVTGNTYTASKDDIGDFAYFVVEYEKYRSTLTKNISADVYVEYSFATEDEIYDNGTVVKFKPYWRPDSTKKDKYKLAKVAFNNVNIYKDADGYYTVTIEDDSKIDITITKLGSEFDGGMEVYNGIIPGEEPDTPVNPPVEPPVNPPVDTPDNSGDKGGCASNITSQNVVLFILSLAGVVVVYLTSKKVFNK